MKDLIPKEKDQGVLKKRKNDYILKKSYLKINFQYI